MVMIVNVMKESLMFTMVNDGVNNDNCSDDYIHNDGDDDDDE